jgi:hypothetical protein
MQTTSISCDPPDRLLPGPFDPFRRVGSGADVEIVHLDAVRDPAPERVASLLSGRGLLLVASGEGTSEAGMDLLAALHLALSPAPLAERSEALPTGHPLALEAGPLLLERPFGVTGVGWVLHRVQENPVSLYAPRGEGRLLLLGSPSPFASSSFAAAVIRWISPQTGRPARSI